MTRSLILILGDQLNLDLSALRDADASQDAVMMCEVMQEATYVKHHKKKIAFVFSAMRHLHNRCARKAGRCITASSMMPIMQALSAAK